MVGQVELALRVATGLFVVVAPTLLFLGLWRGLDTLRDDELIEHARREGYLQSSPSRPSVPTALLPDVAESDATVCDACGASNLAEASYCRECLSSLEG